MEFAELGDQTVPHPNPLDEFGAHEPLGAAMQELDDRAGGGGITVDQEFGEVIAAQPVDLADRHHGVEHGVAADDPAEEGLRLGRADDLPDDLGVEALHEGRHIAGHVGGEHTLDHLAICVHRRHDEHQSGP